MSVDTPYKFLTEEKDSAIVRKLTMDDIEELFSTQPVAKSIEHRLISDFLKIKPSKQTLSNRPVSKRYPHLVLDGALIQHRPSRRHLWKKQKQKQKTKSKQLT